MIIGYTKFSIISICIQIWFRAVITYYWFLRRILRVYLNKKFCLLLFAFIAHFTYALLWAYFDFFLLFRALFNTRNLICWSKGILCTKVFFFTSLIYEIVTIRYWSSFHCSILIIHVWSNLLLIGVCLFYRWRKGNFFWN